MAGTLLATGGSAYGQGLANGDYEIGPTTGGVTPGWSGNTGTNFYFGLSTAIGGINPVSGNQFAFVNNFNNASSGPIYSIAQQLPDVLTAGADYSFSGYFGWRNDNPQSFGTIQMLAGGTVSQGQVVGGTLLASENVALTQGGWVLASIEYVALTGSALLGENVSVELIGTPSANGFAQTDFDDASFDVPEPISLTLFGFGAAALGMIHRRGGA